MLLSDGHDKFLSQRLALEKKLLKNISGLEELLGEDSVD